MMLPHYAHRIQAAHAPEGILTAMQGGEMPAGTFPVAFTDLVDQPFLVGVADAAERDIFKVQQVRHTVIPSGSSGSG